MAKQLILSCRTARDIDRRVERVLTGLDDPDPPLRLEYVRELLNLDLGFYTADDPGVVREAVSRIRVAGIQTFRRPTLLFDAIKKLSLKALYLPDRRRIILDSSLPQLKHRWNEGHEIAHSIIPWHKDVMLGDNALTLYPYCHEQVEAEANDAAGRLLFLRERFAEESRSVEPSVTMIHMLSRKFGNTLSTTLHRVVESEMDRPLVAMITGHPHMSRREDDFDPSEPCRHVIQSPSFRRRFGNTVEAGLFTEVVRYCGAQRGGPLGDDVLLLTDDNDEDHDFFFETFYNGYYALTIGKYLRPARASVSVSA